jgi:hypothetical protein
MRSTDNEPAREQSGYVPGLGIVRVLGICVCGRLLRAYDFQSLGSGAWQAICSSCHTRVLSIEPEQP